MNSASKLSVLAFGALLAGVAVPGLLHRALHGQAIPFPLARAPEPKPEPVFAPSAETAAAPAVEPVAPAIEPVVAAAPSASAPPPPNYDLSGVKDALRYYHEGEGASGDAALTSRDPFVRATLSYVFLREHPVEAGLARHRDFLAANPDWPSRALRRHAEELAGAESGDLARENAFLAEFPPTSPAGELALALLHKDDPAQGAEVARRLWRNAELTPGLEKKLLNAFGGALTRDDHCFRAERRWLHEQRAGAAHAAALAGKDAEILLRAASAVAEGAPWPKAAAKVAEKDRNEPVLAFARIHALRKAEKIDEAAKLMLAVPQNRETAGGDDWWVERRLLARKLLDAGDFSRAYKIAAGHAAQSEESRLEAEFHAGWIALRFLNDPALAAPHFETMAKVAHTPASIARAAYWRGRVEEARGGEARPLYARAAGESETYYGQLARARLGDEPLAIASAPTPALGEQRAPAVRAAELLFALGEKETAKQLALEASTNLPPEQMAALAEVLATQDDPNLALLAGKSAFSRGVKLPVLAWPVNGAPDFRPLAETSAPRSAVLAIARQESAFRPTARSGVGAMGLMQMMEPTARGAAKRAGIAYDEAKLRGDAAFNAQLGAFHLGELLVEYKGSHILAFAAYNAGGGNVAQWIAAYGDPRDGKIDPVDWVERIPFTETRNYVQRVVENLSMYRALLGERTKSLFDQDLRQKVAQAN